MKVRALVPLVCLAMGAAMRPALAEDIAGKRGEDQDFARSLAESATWAAVAKPGVGVCRLVRVGIAEQDWIRGIVIEVHKPEIIVRITSPGRFPHVLNEIALSKGAIVRAAASGWTPCKPD